MIFQNILDKQNNLNQQSLRVKYYHLSTQNANLMQIIKDLEGQITSLRKVNTQMIKASNANIHILIDELTQQNLSLEQALFRLNKANEELSCDILMKNQLICENENEYKQIINNYEEKIYDLRILLQSKEVSVTQIQQKLIEDKDQTYGVSTYANMMYFNQMNQLRALLDRTNLENAQLKFINSMKEQEIEVMKQQLSRCQKMLKNGSNWQNYKSVSLSESKMQQTTKQKKPQCYLKLEEEITRYDTKYKHLSTTKNTGGSASQVAKMKSLLAKFYHDIQDARYETTKIARNLASKDKIYKLLQEAYKKLDHQMRNYKVQVEFYRNNFKELNKVTTQRKIKYYDEYYEEMLPNLQKKLYQKISIIEYWKTWHKMHAAALQINQKRVLSYKKSNNHRPLHRSNSCLVKLSHFKQSARKSIDKKKQQAIFSFINQTHNVNSIMNFTVDQTRKDNIPQDVFKDEISMIMKPKVSERGVHFKKKKLLELEIDQS